jgi:hypothetical protein
MHLRAKLNVLIAHNGLTDAQLKAIMLKMCKAAKGRSKRVVSIICGDLYVELYENIPKHSKKQHFIGMENKGKLEDNFTRAK